MRRRLLRFFGIEHRFNKEFRRQTRMLIIITLGFTIAFTWRQTVFDVSQAFVQFITNVKSAATSSVLTSVFITLLSVGLIYVSSHFLKEKESY